MRKKLIAADGGFLKVELMVVLVVFRVGKVQDD